MKISQNILRPIKRMPWLYASLFFLGIMPLLCSMMFEAGHRFWALPSTIAESAAAAYIATWICSVIPDRYYFRKAVCTLVCGFYVFAVVADIVCICTTGTIVQYNEFSLMLETNGSEARGFFIEYFSWSAIAKIAVTVLIAAFGIYLSKRLSMRFTRLFSIASLLSLPVLAYNLRPVLINDYMKFKDWEWTRSLNPRLVSVSQILYSAPIPKFIALYKNHLFMRQNVDTWQLLQQEQMAAHVVQAPDSLDFDIVVIIGESFARAHSSLYGYGLETNPRLQAETDSGRLVVYSDVTSPANSTTNSLRNVLCLNSLSEQQHWYESLQWPMLLRQSGWKCYLYDNQTTSASWDLGIGCVLYPNVDLWSQINDKTFEMDGTFLEHITPMFANETDSRKTVFYHLIAQHFPTQIRHDSVGPFSAEDIKSDKPWMNDERRAIVADYDNCTVYNDSIVSEILARFQERPAVAFYFSDHGANCWDLAIVDARNKQYPSDKAWVERNFYVPFFVWMNDGFQSQFADKANAIRQNAEMPGTTDMIGYMVLGLCNPNHPAYRPECDILSADYRPLPRMSFEGYNLELK